MIKQLNKNDVMIFFGTNDLSSVYILPDKEYSSFNFESSYYLLAFGKIEDGLVRIYKDLAPEKADYIFVRHHIEGTMGLVGRDEIRHKCVLVGDNLFRLMPHTFEPPYSDPEFKNELVCPKDKSMIYRTYITKSYRDTLPWEYRGRRPRPVFYLPY